MATKNKVVDKKLNEQAQAELARYRRQRQLKLIKTASASSVVAVVFLVVFGMVIGGAFEGFLNVLGLASFQNEATGIYADCSLSKNNRMRYCQDQKQDSSVAAWRQTSNSERSGSKFRLSD